MSMKRCTYENQYMRVMFSNYYFMYRQDRSNVHMTAAASSSIETTPRLHQTEAATTGETAKTADSTISTEDREPSEPWVVRAIDKMRQTESIQRHRTALSGVCRTEYKQLGTVIAMLRLLWRGWCAR